MNGDLDDPLLLSTVGPQGGMNSSLGGGFNEDSSL
jgi:hypothetical protein